MKITSNTAERSTILATAQAMATAARTAPKAKGLDYLETLILTDEDLEILAEQMEKTGSRHNLAFFTRDAENIRKSTAVLLLATSHNCRGLNEACQFCGSENCAVCAEKGSSCAFDPLDLGIAIGSAVSVAAAAHIDNRVMFSAGVAARELNLFGKDLPIVIGIPLSATGKSPYFDRQPK